MSVCGYSTVGCSWATAMHYRLKRLPFSLVLWAVCFPFSTHCCCDSNAVAFLSVLLMVSYDQTFGFDHLESTCFVVWSQLSPMQFRCDCDANFAPVQQTVGDYWENSIKWWWIVGALTAHIIHHAQHHTGNYKKNITGQIRERRILNATKELPCTLSRQTHGQHLGFCAFVRFPWCGLNHSNSICTQRIIERFRLPGDLCRVCEEISKLC